MLTLHLHLQLAGDNAYEGEIDPGSFQSFLLENGSFFLLEDDSQLYLE